MSRKEKDCLISSLLKALAPQGGIQNGLRPAALTKFAACGTLLTHSKRIQRKRFIDLEWVLYFRRRALDVETKSCI